MPIDQVGTSTLRDGKWPLVLGGSEKVPLLHFSSDYSPKGHYHETRNTLLRVAHTLRANRRNLCCCLEGSIVLPYACDVLIW